MNPEELFIVTAQPEFAHAAVTELRQFDEHIGQREELAPGIILCQASDTTQLMRRAAQKPPVFTRHLAPVQAIISLEQTEQDIGQLATTIVGNRRHRVNQKAADCYLYPLHFKSRLPGHIASRRESK